MRLFVFCLLSWVAFGIGAVASDQRLTAAVKEGRLADVTALIKERVNVNTPEADGTTALHWAAEHSNEDIVDLLIQAGARPNVTNDYGMTPLALASRNGNVAIVRALLKADAAPNTVLSTGETAIMAAARAGSSEVVSLLVDAGANLTTRENAAGQTALMWAAAEGHTDVVRILIDRGADPRAHSRAGFTSLLFAARNGDIETTRVLLAAGVDINDAAPDGTTALTMATMRSHIEYANFLLSRRADPNKGPGFTPLHWVVGDWSVELAGDRTHLRPEGTEWDRVLPLQGQARLDLAQRLLDHGADVNAKATSTPRLSVGTGGGGGRNAGKLVGATPFWMAAQIANIPMMRLLLANGADPLFRTARNVSPLMAAAGVDSTAAYGTTGVAEKDALEAIELCMTLGDDVHTVSKFGETALHGAAYRGNAGANKISQLLLQKGIDVNIKNSRGWTALTIAEGIYTNMANTKNPELLRLLAENGATPSPVGIERNAYAIIFDDRQ
jgi:ankyrin repeat protein